MLVFKKQRPAMMTDNMWTCLQL